MIAFTINSIKHSFAWGCVCKLSVDGWLFREESKLAWDRLGAPKMLKRVIDLKTGDMFEATLMRPGLKVGDRLSLADIEVEITLWSDWQ